MSAESTPSDPYEVVLEDLRAKKAQIEQAITAIEALRGGAASAGTNTSSKPAAGLQNDDIDSPGAFLGMSIADAAKKLLAAKRQPLKNPDISAAFKRGGLVLNSKDPINTIGSVLTRRSNEVGDLVKVGRGTWGLKEWYPGRSFKKGATADSRDAHEDAVEQPKEQSATASQPVSEADSNRASIPFMITQAMRDKLRQYGASDDDIKHMTPAEARSYIADFDMRNDEILNF
jgi:DNA-directed RNA polymerase delta subunit